MEKMYSFEEIGLIPKKLSTISSRKDVNPYYMDPLYRDPSQEPRRKLPIFVSPMTCILDQGNINKFNASRFIPILPVTPDLDYRISYRGWKAVSIQEAKTLLESHKLRDKDRILIDCANGHMETVYELVVKIKQFLPRLEIMIGNIANPETYIECCRYGVDYVRVGIGGGSGCTTSVLTGFHASLPWLLQRISQIRSNITSTEDGSLYLISKGKSEPLMCETKVIADGGINTESRIIKSLALGADYVMMGRAFASCKESCGPLAGKVFNVNLGQETEKRWYYGQSSEMGQKDRFGHVKGSPEGCEYPVTVDTNLSGLADRFETALRSAMSYAGAQNLREFIGKVDYQVMSTGEYNSYIK